MSHRFVFEICYDCKQEFSTFHDDNRPCKHCNEHLCQDCDKKHLCMECVDRLIEFLISWQNQENKECEGCNEGEKVVL